MSHPAVADSAVIGIPNEWAGEVPKAYVVLRPSQQIGEEELKQFIAGTIQYHSWNSEPFYRANILKNSSFVPGKTKSVDNVMFDDDEYANAPIRACHVNNFGTSRSGYKTAT